MRSIEHVEEESSESDVAGSFSGEDAGVFVADGGDVAGGEVMVEGGDDGGGGVTADGADDEGGEEESGEREELHFVGDGLS